MNLTDLVKAAYDGDTEAEAQLFRLLHVRFLAVAKFYLGYEDAQDAAQQACLTVAEKYRTLSTLESFDAWAHQVLRNKVGNILKHHKVESRILSGHSSTEVPSPAAARSDESARASLLLALREVAAHDRRYVRALNLVHLGFGGEEIARRMGITRNHLYVLLHRGRTLLARYLEDHHE